MRLLPLKILKVEGHSMEPGIPNGSFLLVNAWAYFFSNPKIGEIVIFKSSKNSQLLCKRIAAINERQYFLQGDNVADSLDSREFGQLPREKILGKVIACRFFPRSDQ